MSRLLKFRAWYRGGDWIEEIDKDEFVMIEPENLMLEDSHLIYGLKDVEDEVYYMQFTGLLDVHGKEIYEGDYLNIGSVDFGFIKNNKGEIVKYEVKHIGCDYVLWRTDLDFPWGKLSRLEELGWVCQVAGNIYQNS